MAQALHAALAFAYRHPEHFKAWMKDSEYIVVLNVKSESHLLDLIERANDRDISHAYFREHDLGGEFTAASFQPGKASQKLCANLPLAFRQRTEPVDLGDVSPDVSQRYATEQKGHGGSR